MKSGALHFQSLRARILFLVLLIVIPVLTLLVLSNLEQRRIEKARVRENALAISKLAASSQAAYVKNARQLLATIAQFPFLVLASNAPFAETHLSNLRLLSPDYSNFGLVEPDGLVFCDAILTNKPVRLAGQPFLQKAIEKKSFVIGEYQPDPLSAVPCLNFAYPIQTEQGQLRRVFFASLKLSLLSENLSQIPLPAQAAALVADRAGNVIAAHPDSALALTNLSRQAFFQRALRPSAAVFEANWLDGRDRLFAVSSLVPESDDSPLAIITVPRDLSFSQANAVLARNLLVVLVVTGLALTAGWLYADRLFLRPIQSLVSASSRLAAGDTSARSGISKSSTELEQLSRAFDSMAENLQRRQFELEQANAEINKINAELERRVQARTAELEESNKQLESFSYSVSHDLRAPLRHIDAFTNLLLTECNLPLDERSSRYLNTVNRASKQMGVLIDDLLSFSRTARQAMRRTKTDSNELIRGVVTEIEHGRNGPAIQWQIDSLPIVQADPSLLRQVWHNLISNAVKYSKYKEGPRIHIGTQPSDAGETIFFVRDNGAGFDMKYAHKLFGVFQRLHRPDEFEGTGIGLAIVHRIIHRHAGRVWAESEPGQGASFYFSIPASTD